MTLAVAACSVPTLGLESRVHSGVQSGRVSPNGEDAGIRRMLANQPDHLADVEVESSTLGDSAGHVVKKGGTYRLEISRTGTRSAGQFIVIDQSGKQIIGIYPSQRTYTVGKVDPVLVPVFEGSVERFLTTPGAGFREEGDQEIDDHKCLKIVARDRKGDLANFFLARDLQNLVIKIEVVDKGGVWLTVRLKNISLDVSSVPDSIFRIPSGYTEQRP